MRGVKTASCARRRREAMLAVLLGLPYNAEERARKEARFCSAQHAVLRARASELRHVPLSELKRTVRVVASTPASFLCIELCDSSALRYCPQFRKMTCSFDAGGDL